ncbi:MAG TPA: ribose 5-phosphate isomerase B [Polyangiaceae bacterium]|nr:ribose 5-phosphate isomerase B [Polyangiaceae bacterium]
MPELTPLRIALGSDHAGFPLKERVKTFLQELGHEVVDFGCFNTERCDYPDFCRPAAEAVRSGDCQRCIVFGGSGNGEAIVANRVPGVRAPLCWNLETARLGREHNDANGLALGARVIDHELALEIVRVWLNTPFEGGRHVPRIRKIDDPGYRS